MLFIEIYRHLSAFNCDLDSNDNENIKQMVKLSLASVVKKYFVKGTNWVERLLRGNNSKDFEFTSEIFILTEIHEHEYSGSWD